MHTFKNSFNNLLKATFCLIILSLYSLIVVQAQINGSYLYNNGNEYTIDVGIVTVGKKYLDIKIPNEATNYLQLTVKGGDGGKNTKWNNITHKGGEGATIVAAFKIGNGDNELSPGGKLRVIVGRKGNNANEAGGGGGGTGILYQKNQF